MITDMLITALGNLRPGVTWTCYGPQDYANVVWIDDVEPPTAEEVAAEITRLEAEAPAKAVRAERDRLLATVVDPINAVRWAAMTEPERAAWTAYRQALLDVPEQAGFPSAVVWPEVPA